SLPEVRRICMAMHASELNGFRVSQTLVNGHHGVGLRLIVDFHSLRLPDTQRHWQKPILKIIGLPTAHEYVPMFGCSSSRSPESSCEGSALHAIASQAPACNFRAKPKPLNRTLDLFTAR
ncbi:hypothetical protein C2E31_25850, partial [Rhodopirellula baltica]